MPGYHGVVREQVGSLPDLNLQVFARGRWAERIIPLPLPVPVTPSRTLDLVEHWISHMESAGYKAENWHVLRGVERFVRLF